MTTLELPAKSVLCTPGKANGNPLQNFRCYVIGIQDRNYSIAEIIETLSKRINGRPGFEREDTDGNYFPRLLRACYHRTAKRGYEFSPSDVDCHATLHGVMPMKWGDDITL